MQTKREWKWNNSYQTDSEKNDFGYDSKKSNIEYKWVANFSAGKIKSLKSNQIIYKVKNLKGQSIVDKGKVAGLESKYKEPQKIKEYNFDKFTSGISQDAKLKEKAHTIIKKHLDEDYNEDDPIKIDNSDSKFLFDNEDAIVVDLKKGNSN